jgi:hypothetical protein
MATGWTNGDMGKRGWRRAIIRSPGSVLHWSCFGDHYNRRFDSVFKPKPPPGRDEGESIEAYLARVRQHE